MPFESLKCLFLRTLLFIVLKRAKAAETKSFFPPILAQTKKKKKGGGGGAEIGSLVNFTFFSFPNKFCTTIEVFNQAPSKG